MNRCRRPLGAALSAVLVLALASPALAQDQPMPSEEPAPPPPARPRPKPTPAKPTPREAPAKEAPAKQAPAKEAPAKQAPAKQAPAEVAPAPSDQADDLEATDPPPEPVQASPAGEEPQEPAAGSQDETVAADDRAEPRPDVDDELSAGASPAPRAVPSPDVEPGSVEATMVVSYGPHTLDYEEGDTIPDGYVKDRRMRTGLVVGGAVTLGLSWLASCGAAAYFIWNDRRSQEPMVDGFNDIPGEAALAIPLAGPFIAIDTVDPSPAGMALLVADGVIQVGALTMLITGLAAKETVLVRTESSEVALLPNAGPGQGGMSLSGTF